MWWWRPKSCEHDLEREISSDLELEAEEQQAHGLSPREARDAARRAFGSTTFVKEQVREMWGWMFLDRFKQDIVYALRGMRKSPGFTLVAALSLALGVGANTTIFTLLNAVLLKSLPVAAPEQLVQIVRSHPAGEAVTFPYPHYKEFRDNNRVFSGVAAISNFGPDVTVNGQTERAAAILASGNFFSLLGVQGSLGRVFTQEDDRQGSPVAVISDEYWHRRFAKDPSVVGRTVVVTGRPVTIIGVAPPGFYGMRMGASTDIYLPIQLQPQVDDRGIKLQNPVGQWIYLIARLKPEISRQQAQADLGILFYRTYDEMLASMTGTGRDLAQRVRSQQHLTLKPIRAGMASPIAKFSDPLKVLMAVVGIVLLIACANIANLLLARAAARRKEIAVRLAIGAGRIRVLRQLVTESVTLTALGTTGGVLFSWWGSRFLLHAASTGPAVLPLDISPDARVFAFTLSVSLLTALLFGLAPAFRATREDPQIALKANAGSGARGGARLGKALLVAQVALSLLLLVGAGLFLRSLAKLEGVDAGFRRDHLLLFNLNPGRAGYKGPRLRTFYNDLLAQLDTLSGVRSAAISAQRPLDGGWGEAIHAPGYIAPSNEQRFISCDSVTTGYFETMGATLLAGRDFLPRDDEKAAKVAILNEFAARTYFANQNPIGKRVGMGLDGPADIEVVGVVKDMKYRGLRSATERVLYTPLAQVASAALMGVGGISVEVRTQDEPLAIAAPVRGAVGKLIPGAPIERFQTMEIAVDNQLMPERLVATLSAFFGALAVMLAAIGLYGVTAYAVARRTGEIGIRMALGARQSDVQWHVMRETMVLVVVGALAGIGSALAASRVAVSLLYGVSASDPVAIAGALSVLVTAALLAGWIPARRASRVDPMVALRNE